MYQIIFPYITFASQLVLAILLGGLLGWQRVKIGKAAGPRTYALVTMSSTLFTILSFTAFNLDPAKVASQILTGIGFLCAGIIIHKNGGIEGLTTAAGLWAVTAIGMAIGVGWYTQAVIGTILMFIVLSIDDHFFHKK